MEGNISGVGTEGGGSSVPEEGAGERGLEQPTTASDRGWRDTRSIPGQEADSPSSSPLPPELGYNQLYYTSLQS